jgi:phytoene synthase
MSIEIFGYSNPTTKDFAVKLGVALQLTNILRDIKKDAEEGRIYLPLEDLRKFNYSEDELIRGEYNNNFIELMEYESARAQEFYTEANSLLPKEDTGLMFPALIMRDIYHKLLKKIESHRYNVFKNEIHVSKSKKMTITFGIYLKHKLFYNMKDPRNLDTKNA